MAALIVWAVLACSSSKRDLGGESTNLSVVLVTFDTLRADHVGSYGSAVARTPNLDRLALEGVRFAEARAHAPLTAPSHATLLTGLLPPRHAVRGNALFRLEESAPTLATALKAKGYRTAAVVSSVVLDRICGLDRGFDVYDDNQRIGEKSAFNYLERAASQVVEAVAREMPRLEPPFFLWAHLYDPHRPWVAPAAFGESLQGHPYDAEIAFADFAFGEIWRMAAARAGGRIIVAAASDHGESLGQHGENQHGFTLHRGVLRVPLLLAGEGIPRARTVTATVGLVDVAPTLAELTGVSLGAIDGTSLSRFWSSKRPPHGAEEPSVLWEESLHPLYDAGWAPLRGLLTERWHLVDSPRPELYDRESDPDDRTDLASDNPDVLHQLRTQLAEMGARLGDESEPAPPAARTLEDREHLERLASLGYLGTGSPESGRVARLDPKDGLPGFIAVEEAEELIERGQAREACERVEPHTRRDPRNPRLWHTLGKAWLLRRDLARAEQALERAMALDPHSAFIRYSFAALLRAKGDAPAARAELEKILAANPRAVEASLELAAMSAAEGDAEQALKVLQASHAAGARDPDLLDALGRHELRAGRKDEAARYFREALILRPRDALALLEMGRAALRSSDPSAAIEYLSGCTEGAEALACRVELARAYVVGPRDLGAARAQLLAARKIASNATLLREVDLRLQALEGMAATSPGAQQPGP